MTAYVRADAALGLGDRLLGALSVVVSDPTTGEHAPTGDALSSLIVTLAANAEAAAGAYGLLLVRVLGEPSTLGDTTPEGKP